MGGTSSQQQTQNSTTNPWQPAVPALNGILGQVQGGLNNTGTTPQENGALNTIQQNATNWGTAFQPGENYYAASLLDGGGANNQAGNVNQNYQNYYNQTNPLASNLNYDPNQNPGTAALLAQIQGDVTNGVNGQFAAAGRDMSGMNQQTWARGIAQGEAPVLFDQYNANRTAQQGAAGNLYNAGNTNAGLLTGLQQQFLANQGQGATAVNQSLDLANAGSNATLQAEAQRRGIPVQALGLLAQIGIPIAGLGGQSTGQSSGTNTMSGAQQFGTIAGGVGNLLGGAGNLFTGLGKFSDRRLKEDIEQVGALFDGTPVYRYRYLGQLQTEIGLMAQDVEKYAPDAVGESHGFKTVDYKLATEKALQAGDF